MSKQQELICTKINHDIIGHVGAICNAVELLEEDDLEFIDDIKSILKISSFALVSRLKFFRIAFGLDNAVIDDAQKIIKDYTSSIASKNYPININYIKSKKEIIKPILLIIMILSEIIYKGGEICIDDNKITTKAPCFNQEKLNNLTNIEQASQIPSNAAYFYLKDVLDNTQKKLNINIIDDNNITIEVQ